ncbi:hypothetical protein ACVW17_006178 [Bradyrhizobium sp. USDA 4473]
MDTGRAKAITALSHAEVEPILPALLEWMQDINWPVAQVLQPFLAGIGEPLAPHVRSVLKTDDDVWKRWVLLHIVAASPELLAMLGDDIERLATYPTPGERAEELDIVAKGLLV